ncbi:hypothetical protein QF042_000119 [Pedobacter sp. W3I1]|nr:hypothetical protein [Pedobacter sp. W3I1]
MIGISRDWVTPKSVLQFSVGRLQFRSIKNKKGDTFDITFFVYVIYNLAHTV